MMCANRSVIGLFAKASSAGPQKMSESAPIRSIFFYPHKPSSIHKVEFLRQHAGWILAETPETADWCVLHHDTTWVHLPDDDPWAKASATWINGRCRDISKRMVQRVFAEVFGYPLAIDPLTHEGLCLRKSDKNYVKDAVIIECPIPAREIDDRFVYERLVDSRVPPTGTRELRVAIAGKVIVAVRRWIRPDWFGTRRYDATKIDEAIVEPRSVFSPWELDRLVVFCDAIGLDLGELDIIRDRVDERIYILDVNKTPGYDLDRVWAVGELEEEARAFTSQFAPRAALLASAEPETRAGRIEGHDPQWTEDSQDDGNRMMARIDALSARSALLQADVRLVHVRLAQLTTILADAPWPSRKNTKKRKK